MKSSDSKKSKVSSFIFIKIIFFAMFISKMPESIASESSKTTHFKGAKAQGQLGETSNLYLFKKGFYFHPLYNDLTGGTDKHLTGSIKFGYIGQYKDSFEYELLTTFRLITPAYKPANNRKTFGAPVGSYADWWEVKGAMSFDFDYFCLNCRLQFSPSINHIGNKGARNVQHNIHLLVGSSTEHDINTSNTNNDFGAFLAYTIGINKELPVYKSQFGQFNHQLESSYTPSKALSEFSIDYNFLFELKEDINLLAGEIRYIRQLESQLFNDLEESRFEIAIGKKFNEYFTPTVKYISPFLKGDDRGQIYLDFIHLHTKI